MPEAYIKTVSTAPKPASGLWLRYALAALVALLPLFVMRLFPESASRLGRELHYEILLPVVFCVLAAFALRTRGFIFPACSLALVALFFLLQLWWLWISGTSDTMLVGGVLPFSDASDYLVNAQLLAGGERIQGQGHANDHMLATAMLAVLWKATQGDYRLILVLITLLGAVSTWLAMVEVSILLGTAACIVWLLVDVLFLRRYIGVPLSEHLGMILGNLGLALGCRAVRVCRLHYMVLASFALTLALCARPGAMLTIPAFVLSAIMAWPQKKLRRWILPSAMAAAALAAVILNKLVANAVGNQNPDAAVSNAAYVLHSLVYGGTWTDAMNRYGNDRLAVWHAVEVQIRAHPFSLLSGGERSLMAFIRQGYLFCFVNSRWLNVVLHLTFATGAIAVVLKLRRDRRAWWLFAFLAGLLASMALLPPWDTDNMRSYAATIPLIAFTAAVGIHALASVLRSSRSSPNPSDIRFVGGAFSQETNDERSGLGRMSQYLLAVVLVLCALLPPLFRPHVLPPKSSIEDTYRENRTDAAIVYLPRIALKLVANSMPASSLTIRLADFRAGLSGFSRLYPGESELLASLPADCAIIPTLHEFSFIAIDRCHIPIESGAPTISLNFRFLAEGWLLLAVDEALFKRSATLAAYESTAIGPFSFGINRFPVIHTGDTITLAENVLSIDFFQPARHGRDIISIKPILVGSRRLHFPVPGEYYLKINGHYLLKLLVIERDSGEAESKRLISNFVESNCIVNPDDGVGQLDAQTSFDSVRFFESESPAPLRRSAMLQLIAQLETTARRSGPK